MKKLIALLLITLVLIGCGSVPQKGEFNTHCSYSLNADGSVALLCDHITTPSVATATPTSLPVASPTPKLTSTPMLSPTATVTLTQISTATPILGINLFKDPGMEGPYVERPNSDGYNHITPRYWNPFYCDNCPSYRQGTGNPFGLVLGRPEYKPAAADQDSLRIHKGKNAVEYFGFYRVIEGGVYQTVDTIPGSTCLITVYVQAWSGTDSDKDAHVSHLITQDDKDNATFFVIVDPLGGTNAFAGGLLKSRSFGYNDGIYDRWSQISFVFTATGSKTTIFFDGIRLWPIRNNNNYLDDASVVCAQ